MFYFDLWKIFYKMFACMARAEEKSELVMSFQNFRQGKRMRAEPAWTEPTPKNFHMKSGSRFIFTAVC